MEHDYTMAWPWSDSSTSPAPTDAVQAFVDFDTFATTHNYSDGSSASVAPSERAWFDEGAGEAITPGRGTFFDEHIDMRDPEGAALTARILEIFDTVRPRRRRRNCGALANHLMRIRKLLANALRGHYFRKPPAVLYFRKVDSEWYEDKPTWMRHGVLAEAVDALVDAGLVTAITGKLMPHHSERPSWASSYAPTDELTCIAAECGVFAESIDWRRPSDELVQLFGPKPNPVFDWNKGGLVHARKGKPIKFDPTAETQKWTATLKAINAFYRQQGITLGLSPAELALWLAERNADQERIGAPYRLPEMFQTDIYRVFNNGEDADPRFDEGGRLFGGWWMSVPGDLREAITINGQPTVELDYSECHPRMLYHERGLDGEGELYVLPEIAAYEEAAGVAPRTYRPCVKWLMQVLINGRGRPKAAEKPDHIVMPPGYTIEDIIGFIEARHQPIADAFKTGAGMRLMRLESDIALEIVSTAMIEGWTILSVHDSFITPLNQLDRLKEIMIDAYVKRSGREPIIKQ